MKPVDFRNENFHGMRNRIPGQMADVLAIWRQHGPGTTLEVAARSEFPLLTLRPRTTDLEDIGAVVCTGRILVGRIQHGLYQARTEQEWAIWFAEQQKAAISNQTLMPI